MGTMAVIGNDVTESIHGVQVGFQSGKQNVSNNNLGYRIQTAVRVLSLDRKGQCFMELYDKNNVKVVDKMFRLQDILPAQSNLACTLVIVNAAASALVSDVDNIVLYDCAPAEFTTGKVVIRTMGKVSLLGVESIDSNVQDIYSASYNGNGFYEITMPFSVV